MKDRYIQMAIKSWEDKKNGVYRWWENERYDVNYCEKQINYFKNLKL
jgi:hypothetical protein